MTKKEKVEFIKGLSEELKDVPHAFLVDYRGLTVLEASDLRLKIRESGSKYQVVKNTMARLAVKDTQLEQLGEHFVGPIAIATHKEDPVALAKALVDYSKENKKLEIKIGVLDGQLLKSEEIIQLSKIQSREQLLSKLAYLLQYPIQGLASALNNIIRNLPVVLNQVSEAKN